MNFSKTDHQHDVAQILSLFYSIFIVYQVCFMLPELFPSLKIEPVIDMTQFIKGLEGIAPESLERLRFTLSLILLPSLIFLFNWLFIKLFRRLNIPLSLTYNFLSVSALIAVSILLWKGLKAVNFYYIENHYFFKNPILYGVLFVFMIFLIYLYEIKFEITFKKPYHCLIKTPFIIVTALLIFSTFLFCIFNFASLETYENHDHLDSMLNSIAQVFAGKPLLINSYSHYGFYAQLLEPVFRITGLSISSFTILMGFLLCLSYLCIFLFINGTVKHKLLGYLGFAQLLFVTCYLSVYYMTDPYYQYRPLRILFPSVMILLTWLYFSRKNNKYLYYTSFMVSSVGIFWNSDTGLVIFAAWIAVLGFQEFVQSNFKTALKNTFSHAMKGFIILALVIGFYCGYDFVRYGAFPDFNSYFRYLQFFYVTGYFCMPMPLIHPWNILALIYLIGLAYSFKNLILKKDSLRTKLIFFLSILGLGLFSYYQGRSHDLNLEHIAYPGFLLLTLYADSLFSQVKNGIHIKQFEFKKIIILLGILFLFLSSYFDLFGSPLLYPVIRDRVKLAFDTKLRNGSIENLEFFKRYTKPGERILILSYRSSPYYTETNTGCSADVPSLIESFFQSNHEKLVDYLKNNRNPNDKIFVASTFVWYSQNEEISNIISERYREVDRSSNGDIVLYMKQ